uniref:Uncharacterized protein n=1 Tax=Anopheles stephensi TaxID=30069 RepID=A0A182YQS8_ANOST
MNLADPMFDKSAPVDIILGACHYHALFENATQLRPAPHQLVMINMTGTTADQNVSSKTHPTTSYSIVCMASLEESLQRFWQLENLTVNDAYSPEERHCESFYKPTTERDDTDILSVYQNSPTSEKNSACPELKPSVGLNFLSED